MQVLISSLINDIEAMIKTYEPVNEHLSPGEKLNLLRLKECCSILTDSENVLEKKKNTIAA